MSLNRPRYCGLGYRSSACSACSDRRFSRVLLVASQPHNHKCACPRLSSLPRDRRSRLFPAAASLTKRNPRLGAQADTASGQTCSAVICDTASHQGCWARDGGVLCRGIPQQTHPSSHLSWGPLLAGGSSPWREWRRQIKGVACLRHWGSPARGGFFHLESWGHGSACPHKGICMATPWLERGRVGAYSGGTWGTVPWLIPA